jgi:hypothetical protein
VNPRQLDKKIDKIAGLIETLDYDFFSNENEDSALRCQTQTIILLEEFQSIVERDDAIKQLKKG